MKQKNMALLLAMICLISLLSGCGTAETMPTEPSVTITEAPSPEAVTEPATEPTTIPTESPTLVEEQGYALWDGAEKITPYESWTHQGMAMPVSGRIQGSYEDVMMQFGIVGSDGKEYRDMAPTSVDIQIAELPGACFEDGIKWIEDALAPFYKADKKQESGSLTWEDWIAANADQKLVYVETAYRIKGTELYLQTIENGVKMKDLKVGYTIPDIVNALTGEAFSVKETYDHLKPEVGCWQMGPDGQQGQLQAWYTCSYSWNVSEGNTAEFLYTNQHYLLMPADCGDIVFCLSEYATPEKISRFVHAGDGKSTWGQGSILDEAFTGCEDYQFRFFGLDVTE